VGESFRAWTGCFYGFDVAALAAPKRLQFRQRSDRRSGSDQDEFFARATSGAVGGTGRKRPFHARIPGVFGPERQFRRFAEVAAIAARAPK
jgi:hypothetical protein